MMVVAGLAMLLLINHSFSCTAPEGLFIVFTTLGRPVALHPQTGVIDHFATAAFSIKKSISVAVLSSSLFISWIF